MSGKFEKDSMHKPCYFLLNNANCKNRLQRTVYTSGSSLLPSSNLVYKIFPQNGECIKFITFFSDYSSPAIEQEERSLLPVMKNFFSG